MGSSYREGIREGEELRRRSRRGGDKCKRDAGEGNRQQERMGKGAEEEGKRRQCRQAKVKEESNKHRI